MNSIVYYVCKVKSNIFYYITKYGFQRKYGRFVHMCLAFVINHDYRVYVRMMVSGHFFMYISIFCYGMIFISNGKNTRRTGNITSNV